MTTTTATSGSHIPLSETSAALASPGSAEAFAERLFGDYVRALEVIAVHVGVELGLYGALAASGPACPGHVARATGLRERYVREWLEQQAAAGVLEVDEPSLGADERRYRLPEAHRDVLVDTGTSAFLAGGAAMVAGIAEQAPRVIDAFRGGEGVRFADYGRPLAHGIAEMNRPIYRAELVSGWLPRVPGLEERLRRPRARVLDLGCGYGATTIEMARAYPLADVVGVDLDAASLRRAEAAAAEAGVADRVRFTLGDAACVVTPATFDLVSIFEALHDMGDPVGALRAARQALRPGGVVLVMDERVAETFTAPGDEVERFCYAASVLHCLPATMAEHPVEANGTVLRPSTLRRWADEAGFSRAETLPIETPFWRFYLLVP